MMRRLRMIEEEEGNLDQQFELPPDFDANKELANSKAKFIGMMSDIVYDNKGKQLTTLINLVCKYEQCQSMNTL
jgi:hypothetical protein